MQYFMLWIHERETYICITQILIYCLEMYKTYLCKHRKPEAILESWLKM